MLVYVGAPKNAIPNGMHAEFAEGGEGFAERLAGGDEAPLEGIEDPGLFRGGLAEGEIRVGVVAVVVDVGIEFGLGAGEAAKDPLTVDDVIDIATLFGAGGFETGMVGGGELGVFGLVL